MPRGIFESKERKYHETVCNLYTKFKKNLRQKTLKGQ